MAEDKIGLTEILISLGLGTLIGAEAARPPDYDKIKNDYNRLKRNYKVLWRFYNGWQNFANNYRRRVDKLKEFNIAIDKNMPKVTQGVLNTAIRCYLFGLDIPTCIMAARAVEIHLRFAHKKLEGRNDDINFDGLIKWSREKEFIKELDNVSAEYLRKARNLMVHKPAGRVSELDALNTLNFALKIIMRVHV